MSLRGYITEQENIFLLEGKMEDELTSQIMNHHKKHSKPMLKGFEKDFGPDFAAQQFKFIAKSILDLDPTPRKSWRFKIKEWILAREIQLDEDGVMLKRDLQDHKRFNVNKTDFKTRAELAEYISKVKENKGIVDDMFSYTFDIDHSDKRFNIYLIQEKDKTEYIKKLGQCTTWCISTEQMFGRYELPYYLLVDKKEKKQYAIVPTGGQFKDSKQNLKNSEKKFEEFDKILDLRGKYYFSTLPTTIDIIDEYIYKGPKFEKEASDELKLIAYGIDPSRAYIESDGRITSSRNIFITSDMVENKKMKLKFSNVGEGFQIETDLDTLEGCPEIVDGTFNCFDIKLKSLKGGPRLVGDIYDCVRNNLTSLEGAPESVGVMFDCRNNKISKEEVEKLASRVDYMIRSDYGEYNT
jgi:hypothetical protein